MAAEVPWHSERPGMNMRDVAREAAQRAGLSLNAWVEQAIEERAARAGLSAEELPESEKIEAIASRLSAMAAQDAAQAPRRANVSAFSPARGKHMRLVEAAARRIESLANPHANAVERHIADIESSLTRRASEPDALAPLESRLRRIAENLRAVNTFDQQDALARMRDQIAELTRAIAVLGKRSEAQLLPALKALLARVEMERAKGQQEALAPVLRGVDDIRERLAQSPVRALQDEIAAIRARIDEAAESRVDAEAIENLQRDMRNTARSLALIAARMPSQERVEQQIAALAARVEEIGAAPAELAAHVVDLARDLREAVEKIDPTRALRAIERRIEAIAFQGGQAPQTFAAGLQDLRGRIDALAEHPALAEMQERLAALAERPEPMPAELTQALAGLEQALSRAADPSALRALENRVAELGARLASPSQIQESLSALRLSIERLAANSGLRPVDEAIAAMPAKMDALQGEVTAIRRRVDEAASSSVLLTRLDKLQGAVASRLDEMQRALAKQQSGAPSFRTEDVVNQLALRLERAGQAQASDPRALQALENQILRIAERLDRNGETSEAIAALERSMSDLFAQIEAGRQAIPAPAAVDATPALAEAIARDLRALHGESEGRTQASLQALHETLEKVVDRLATLEGDLGALRGRKEPKAPPREPEILIEPGEPFTPPLPPTRETARQELAIELSEPRAAQKSFIAAARRASQMFSHASRPTAPVALEDEEPEIAPAGGIDKPRAALMSLTGMIMLLGAYHMTRAPQDAAIEIAQEPNPRAEASPMAASLLDPMPTGSISRKNSDLLVLAELADAGNPAAQYELGARFADGRETQRDAAKAFAWFQKSADQNYAPAQYRVASAFEKGHGVARSARNAALWYGKAAQAGHVRAMHNLGVLLADGFDGKPDYAAAAAMFRKAAEHGLRDSQYNLALLYSRGLGVEPDLAEAYKFFSLAAAQGDAEAALKRDDVEQRLPVKQLSEARAAAERFTLQKPDPAANEPTPVETIVNAPRASSLNGRQKIADRITGAP